MTRRRELITFFEDYEASLNAAILCDEPGAAAAASAFGETFVDGKQAGVECRRNDDTFVKAIIATCETYRHNGIRALRLEGIDSTPIDQDHVMTRVHWLAEYRDADGTDIPVPFDSVYFVRITGPMKIFGCITGDEQRALRLHGMAVQ
ncbi:MAG: hypothetical protein H0W15_02425 [Gemmatimonadales bacterium]|nr:hypothetical protein [Gemmatimonadales bacterium]